MQSRKRAKPVKFGATAKEKAKKPTPKASEKEEVKPTHAAGESVADEKADKKETPVNKEQQPNDAPVSKEEDELESEDVDSGESPLDEISASITEIDIIEEKSLTDDDEEKEVADEKVELGPSTADKEEEKETEEEVKEASDDPIEKDAAFFNTPLEDAEKKKSSVPYFLFVAVITFIVSLAFFAGVYYVVSNSKKAGEDPKTTAEVTQTVEPTEAPVDLAAFDINVLNGSGIRGEAAKVQTSLESEGFKVVSVGNADTDTYTKTKISAQKSVAPEYLDKLKEALGKSYAVDANIGSISSGSAEVEVIIGSETAN